MAKSQGRKLTKRQAAFVAEYLIDLNASAAARRAGYSKNNADKIGYELLGVSVVSDAIKKAMDKREKRTEVTQDMVVKELARIAFGDLRDVMEWSPSSLSLRSSAELTDDQAASISEISETQSEKTSSMRIKRHDKVKALELLGRHLAMFTDKQEHSGNVTAEVQIFRIPDNGRDN